MELLSKKLDGSEVAIANLLISPFLINTDTGDVYELHYYEFEIDIANCDSLQRIEYPKDNILPKEILDNICPKVHIPLGDNTSFFEVFNSYVLAMKKMKFEDEKRVLPELNNFKLAFLLY